MSSAQLRQHRFAIGAVTVNLVDDDHPAHAPVRGECHHALGHHLNTVFGIDDDRGRFDARQHAHRAAGEIGIARCIDHIYENAVVIEMTDGGIQRVVLFFSWVVKSATVDPFATLPGDLIAPVLASNASRRVVLPAPA